MVIASPLPPLALIAGPTASGKSSLALRLAERTGGVIVNADSAQVYRGLALLSASPGPDELGRAEHRLYGTRDPGLPCSAAEWAADARLVIAEVQRQQRLPILVGGTGLYLRTLLEGIAPVPRIDPQVRAEVRSATAEENRRELELLDPAAASRLAAADTARIARALEVVRSTGRTLADWQRQRAGGIAGDVQLRPLILLPPRDWLAERCDRRFAAMVANGALDEVEQLLQRRLDPALPAMRAIGVREIADHLAGRTTRDAMTAAAQLATRRYAKRQYTWFRHQPPPAWPRFTEAVDDESADRALAVLG